MVCSNTLLSRVNKTQLWNELLVLVKKESAFREESSLALQIKKCKMEPMELRGRYNNMI